MRTPKNSKTTSKTSPGALAPVADSISGRPRGLVGILFCLLLSPAVTQAADGYILDRPLMDERPIVDDRSHACYRYGRCDHDYPREDRIRQQRMDRLAPQAPEPPRYEPMVRRDVEPTPEAELQPRYKDAGSVKEEFKGSGGALRD